MRTGKRYIKVENRRKDLYKINQVAEMLGTTPRTVRYYEQMGILPPIKRTHGKMRLYTKTDLELIKRVKEMQAQGRSLEAIKEELAREQQAVVINRENNKIKILVDSTASIPFDIARQNGIEIIPMHIKLGHEDLFDGVDIDEAQLRQRLEEGRLIPESTPPTEEEFIEIYHRLYEQGAEEIISIHLSSKISKTVEIARKAAAFIKDFNIHVIDAGTVGGGAALMAFAAAANILAQFDIKEILFSIDEVKNSLKEIIIVNNISKILGQEKDNPLLKLFVDFKPILHIEGGNLALYARAKTYPEAEEQVVRYCREQKPQSHIIVLHCGMPEQAGALQQRLEKAFSNIQTIVFPFSSVLTANLSKELIGVAVY